MKKAVTTFILVFAIIANTFSQEKYTADWESLKQHKAVPEWFSDVEFGVYFTWGVYSVPAEICEWYPRIMYVHDVTPEEKWWYWGYEHHKKTYGENFHYHDFIPQWKAEKFDAVEWLDMFESMGVQFVGSIAEHHDGFSLWDSEVNPWNAADMGPKIDIVKSIADETRNRDMKFMATFHHGFHGLYYPKEENSFLRPNSYLNISYNNCEVPQDEKYRLLYGNYSYDEMNELWLAKLNEVVASVSPDYVWFDFGQKFIAEDYRKQFLAGFFNNAEKEGKEVAVNTKGGFFPEELAMVNVERSTMIDIQDEVWVTDFILGSQWSYNKNQRTAIAPSTAVRLLADVVSKNGVLILCVGPKADGTIPEEQVTTMEGIGKWMDLYGEAIYKTEPFNIYGEGPTHFLSDGTDNIYVNAETIMKDLNAADVRYTTRGKELYVIQLGWDENNSQKTLTALAKRKGLKIKSLQVLGSKEKINWKQTSKGLVVNQPKSKPAEADIALVYKITLR